MKKKSMLTFCIGLILASCSNAPDRHADYHVIPLPNEITPAEGDDFIITPNTVIAYAETDTALATNAALLAGYVTELTGFTPEVSTTVPSNNAIILKADLQSENPEAYLLTIDNNLIVINGASPAGNFYGIQTLRKSIPATSTKGNVIFSPVTISDKPRFSYRGAHFDVSRHFFPVDSVKSFIDMLALHNINKLHWHITDDQGWRIEIKKYPLLTEVGSKRAGTCVGHDFNTSDSIPYGGYYTQDEARDIVKYAKDRHITVIPEIDLPGHMLGALASYPSLGCTGGPYEVWQRWGVADDVLCAGNDSTLIFIDDVLDEICDIFPSEYIHIGGDECPKVRWAECPKCQERIRTLGLKDDSHSTKEQKLQSYIMEHAANTLANHNRKMIGWDEILEGGLFPGATVMSWRGEEAAVEAAKKGHDAILTPTNFCYFDYSQSQNLDNEPLGIGGFVPVEKVYSLEPAGKNLTDEEAAHI
ncbi:MAG: beta-N-acetylhexosaminidase, partial [Paramuribaculum sp.]|nr:beta-N-acetylhexosaminidase [Paramuribaculum sp.]